MNAANRRLRIAFVVHDYNRHIGHRRYVAELAARFKRDHEVHVFANTFEDSDPVGITYHHVPAWRGMPWRLSLTFVLPATAIVRGDSTSSTPRVSAGSGTTWQPLTSASRGGTTHRSGRTVRRPGGSALSRALISPLERLRR